MNKVNPTSEYGPQSPIAQEIKPIFPSKEQSNDDRNSAKAMAASKAPSQSQAGDEPALKRDLVELHRRIVTMFTTLNKGLAEGSERKAAEDRAEITARLDRMEEAVNKMEGILRIEMAPQIRAIVQEELEDQRLTVPSVRMVWLGRMLMLGGALAFGVVFADQIQTGAASFFDLLGKLVPIWGHFSGTDSI